AETHAPTGDQELPLVHPVDDDVEVRRAAALANQDGVVAVRAADEQGFWPSALGSAETKTRPTVTSAELVAAELLAGGATGATTASGRAIPRSSSGPPCVSRWPPPMLPGCGSRGAPWLACHCGSCCVNRPSSPFDSVSDGSALLS